eukprot:GHVU01005178.1.p2 GENE.GHVU01005178.1~~GHVU01005178.1.p2  ORF type:complete len:137 (-),score=5.63 GHVU01005178.1:77-487(-)
MLYLCCYCGRSRRRRGGSPPVSGSTSKSPVSSTIVRSTLCRCSVTSSMSFSAVSAEAAPIHSSIRPGRQREAKEIRAGGGERLGPQPPHIHLHASVHTRRHVRELSYAHAHTSIMVIIIVNDESSTHPSIDRTIDD